MSQRFSLKFDEMREGSPVDIDQGQAAKGSDDDVLYPSFGHVRNLCFVWPDGRRLFLNYSYLVAAECNTMFSEIILTFTTHIVTAKGYNLKSLFFQVMGQYLRLLHCTDQRYNSLQPEGTPVVNEILVAPA
jgi:hypothetical protein